MSKKQSVESLWDIAIDKIDDADFESVITTLNDAWDHEAEWDAEDYENETGMPMKEELKYQNLWLIGNDFGDFFDRLKTTG